jgi:hypothetical protein
MNSKPVLFEVLDAVPDTTNADQLAALCLAYGADVEATLAIAAEFNAMANEEEAQL